MLKRIALSALSALMINACTPGTADAVNNPSNPNGAGPAAVNMAQLSGPAGAGGFALLAKTGVSNVIGSAITCGDVGVSPASATYLTGLALSMDASNAFATSASVVAPGQVLAADYASPTPANLTTSILEMESAYADAASRTDPDELNLSGGVLGGLTLAPGLYTWGSSVTIPTDVTLSGAAGDIWILQVSNDLSIASGTSVLLTGGALAKNVYWQVAGEATIHENAHFEGVILSKTGITLQTGASLHGRALAQTMIALDDNAITTP